MPARVRGRFRVEGPSRRAALGLDQIAVLAGVLVVGAATFVFAVLLDSVLEGGELTSWDHPVLDWLVGRRNGGLTATMRVVTALGGTPVLPVEGLAVAGIVARATRSWRPLMFMIATMVGSALLTTGVKVLVARPRPPSGSASAPSSGFAFPSGHAANTAAVIGACAVLLWAYRRTRVWSTIVAAVLIFLVGVSRLYLGVHWLTDVLAGYAVGLGWLAATATTFLVLGARSAGPPPAAAAVPTRWVPPAEESPC